MAELKTRQTDGDVEKFLNGVSPPLRRDEPWQLDALFRRATGFQPVLRGESIVGYGRYQYRYDSGRTGEFLATGFAPRARAFSVYIMPGYAGAQITA